jgi:hypothetical protein
MRRFLGGTRSLHWQGNYRDRTIAIIEILIDALRYE